MRNIAVNVTHFEKLTIKLIKKKFNKHVFFPYLHKRSLGCDDFVDEIDGDGTHDETGEDPANRLGVLRVLHTIADLQGLVLRHAVDEQQLQP